MYIPIQEFCEAFARMAAIIFFAAVALLVLYILYTLLVAILASILAGLQKVFHCDPPLPTFEELDYLIRYRVRNKDERNKRDEAKAARARQ